MGDLQNTCLSITGPQGGHAPSDPQGLCPPLPCPHAPLRCSSDFVLMSHLRPWLRHRHPREDGIHTVSAQTPYLGSLFPLYPLIVHSPQNQRELCESMVHILLVL